MLIQPFAQTGDNYTTFTNYMLDIIMPELPANAWKALCYIYRKTVGWNKESDELSYTQIASGTGIKSSATISEALKVLEAKQYIIKTPGDKWDTVTYKINLALEIEANDTASKTKATSETKAGSASEIEAVSLQKLNTQKKQENNKEKKIPAPRKSAGAAPSEHQRLMQLYQEVLPDHRIVNGKQEGSAAKAILDAGYTPEQAIQVYQFLKARDFYAAQHLSLQTVNKQMGAVLTALKNGVRSGSNGLHIRQGAGQHFERARITFETGDDAPIRPAAGPD